MLSRVPLPFLVLLLGCPSITDVSPFATLAADDDVPKVLFVSFDDSSEAGGRKTVECRLGLLSQGEVRFGGRTLSWRTVRAGETAEQHRRALEAREEEAKSVGGGLEQVAAGPSPFRLAGEVTALAALESIEVLVGSDKLYSHHAEPGSDVRSMPFDVAAELRPGPNLVLIRTETADGVSRTGRRWVLGE